MTNNSQRTLERIARRVPVPEPAYDRLLRRRDLKERNRRVSAAVLAIVLTLVSIAGLMRAFRPAVPPASEPTPKPPGIFSEVGGWIVYGNQEGIWAVDPDASGDDPAGQIQLSTKRGTPLAWSSDGSKLLILSYEPPRPQQLLRLFVLNADGTETTLTTGRDWCISGSEYCSSGGSFSPDGSQVIYAAPPEDTWRSSIYAVDTQGGTPRVLLTGGRRFYLGGSVRSWLSNPTYSPDGTQIAYFDHLLDGPSQLRVMNADGSGVRVLLDGTGYRIYNLAWSPDGQRLAWGESGGLYVVGMDGSGFTNVIPDGAYPHWSPDGSHIAFQRRSREGVTQGECNWQYGGGTLEIADRDGTHVQEFGFCAKSGPWNPLVQPERQVAEVPSASEGLSLTWTLVLVALLTLFMGAVLMRRRMSRNAGNATGPKRPSAS